MKFKQLFEDWGLTNIKLNAGFAEAEFAPKTTDRDAAWELYVELLTRVGTQYLAPEDGDEKTALNSIYSLFEVTRGILKSHGRQCEEFAKVAIVVLNQVIRPFTAKWHKASLAGTFEQPAACDSFRLELAQLQRQLRAYTQLLGSMANVEDMTELQPIDS